MRRLALAAALGAALPLLLAGRPAAADPNDIVLSRFLTVTNGANGKPVGTSGDQVAFRSLASELGIVLSPPLLAPAATLGWSGFEISTALGYTTIDGSQSYWRALEQANPTTGAGVPGALPTVTVMAHKGIVLPLPSFEVGAGMTHLLDSGMYAMVLDGKLALNEGFTRWPLPAVAVRGSVSRLTGSTQLDLTVAGVDVSISKLIGIGKTWSLTPFAGWNYLFIIPRSQVIDATPSVDAYQQGLMGDPSDLNANYVFPNQSAITRQRLFLGFKAHYYKLAFIAQAEYVFSGASASGTNAVPIKDEAGTQQAYQLSVALDF